MNPYFEENYYSDLFSWKELESLINIRPLMHEERVKILDNKSRYQWPNSPWALNADCYPPSFLRELIEQHVIYFTDMSRCTKKINDFARGLEKEYRLPVDAHIYMCRNPTGDHPFGIHFDTSSNVIVQCEGETNFKVWEKISDTTQRTMLNLKSSPILDVDMKPGDAIWIPAYHPHLAISRTCRLSVSFPLLQNPSWDGREYEDRSWIEL